MTGRGVVKRRLNCFETMENLTKLPILDEIKERKWHSADFINRVYKWLLKSEGKLSLFRNSKFEFKLPVIDKKMNVYWSALHALFLQNFPNHTSWEHWGKLGGAWNYTLTPVVTAVMATGGVEISKDQLHQGSFRGFYEILTRISSCTGTDKYMMNCSQRQKFKNTGVWFAL